MKINNDFKIFPYISNELFSVIHEIFDDFSVLLRLVLSINMPDVIKDYV